MSCRTWRQTHGVIRVNALSKNMFRAVALFFAASLTTVPALADDAANAAEVSETALTASFTAAAARFREPAPDQRFAQLFNAWERMDGPQAASAGIAIPSRKPVDAMRLTSSFGTRSDPFSGRAKSHQGIDIPGAIGTPIYATADGIVAKAEWYGGYGNFIQIAHGNSIETRYGHMSRLNVRENDRVRKGQVIGFMGSTGRSTGSHLHYEVRIDGTAVNPMSFVTPGEVMLASLDTGAGGPGTDDHNED